MEMNHDKPFFNGKLIVLRAMEPEDLEVLYQIENDTTLWAHGASNVPYSRFALRKFINETLNDIYADRQLRLIVETRDTHEVAGCIDLFDYNVRHHRAEIGIVIRKPYQSQGFGREAMSLLLRYSFSFLRLHQLYAYVACANIPACQLFETIGFEKTAVLKDWIWEGGDYRSVALYTLCQD